MEGNRYRADLDAQIPVTRRGANDRFLIQNYDLEETIPGTYAHEYIRSLEGSKSPVTTPAAPTDGTLGHLIAVVLGARQNALDIKIALRFLWAFLGRIEGTLVEA